MLREFGDPEARRWLDHLRQISRYKLARDRPIIERLLSSRGEMFVEQAALTAPAG